jgi:hypothetical protein
VILASRLRILGLLAAAGTAAVVACTTTTTTTTFTPITGIEIQSAALVAGFGCGTGPGQVFRYAAAVSFAGGNDAGALVQQSGVPLTNIFDCFADGVFENLPSSDAGSLTFNVAIFAYNEDDYVTKAGLPANLGCIPTPDGGAMGCVPGTQPLTPTQEGFATWTTVCTATQQAGTPVIAVCGPLVSTRGAGLDASTDAATDGPAEATADAATDAAADAAANATDAAIQAPDGAADGGVAADAGDASEDASVADGNSDG